MDMPSPLEDVKIVSLSISTFVLNKLTLKLSAYCPPYALKFSTWYLYCLNTQENGCQDFYITHSISLFVYVYPDNDIVYFCATAGRARKMIALRCNQLFCSKPM